MRIIGGEWRGRPLKTLKGRDVRPTIDRVREAWMSAMGGRFDGLTFVDLFAGTGALGLEVLSRGAEHVVFVEKARGSLRVIEANVATLAAGDRCTVVSMDVFRYLADDPGPFDIALADPPYGSGAAARLAALFEQAPFARELWLEHPSRESLHTSQHARTRRYGDTALTTLTNQS